MGAPPSTQPGKNSSTSLMVEKNNENAINNAGVENEAHKESKVSSDPQVSFDEYETYLEVTGLFIIIRFKSLLYSKLELE